MIAPVLVAAAGTALALSATVGRAASRAPVHAAVEGERPFAVGEELVYRVKFGALPVGTARMMVAGIEPVRGHPTFHVVFAIDGGIPLFRVHDRYESWIDTLTLASRRHVQEIREGRYRRTTRYEIYPEERRYRENGDDSLQASVGAPLDEGSFVYFLRTVRVPVGQTREFHQYFKPDRNPVVIRAIRRDTVEVPSGRYPAVVVRPTIRAHGIFAENGDAELWVSDDPRAMLLQMRSRFAGFTLSLALVEVRSSGA